MDVRLHPVVREDDGTMATGATEMKERIAKIEGAVGEFRENFAAIDR
jgi:hypothetical protein